MNESALGAEKTLKTRSAKVNNSLPVRKKKSPFLVSDVVRAVYKWYFLGRSMLAHGMLCSLTA